MSHSNILSKSQVGLINSLKNKKHRHLHGLFIVEGMKSILEFIQSDYQVVQIFATTYGLVKLGKISENIKCFAVSDSELSKISQLQNPQGALALVKIPNPLIEEIDKSTSAKGYSLLLDDVQDPGNMGTIIRTAEWFGIKQVVCSVNTVDVYNPKVVQATMGSLSRMQIVYTDLISFIKESNLPVYGALMEGKSIYKTKFEDSALILFGNEGNGISEEFIPWIDYATTIPNFGAAESLNVAVAATVFCSQLVKDEFEC